MTRAIIILPERGIFLGTVGQYATFSNMDPFGVVHAVSFDDKASATEYANLMFPQYQDEIIIHELQTDLKFVPIATLIKLGYSAYTEHMLSSLPTSDTIH